MNAKLIQLKMPSNDRPILTEFFIKAKFDGDLSAGFTWGLFQYVADISCRDLEDAFYISNNPEGHDMSHSFKPVGKHRPYSMSVGDLVLFEGKLFRCDPVGWKEVTDKHAIAAVNILINEVDLEYA